MKLKTDPCDAIKQSMNEFSKSGIYIPLHGKHTTNPEEETFDLAQKVNEFFVFDDTNSSDPRVLLLIGDTGSGKSVFMQQLFQQSWKTRSDQDPIPLWIPLPELLNPFEGAVEEILAKAGFSESQIDEMKKRERFIFIVDGYDELHQFQNCYVTNKWNEWNAKVLITCRSQALYYQKDPDKYFIPFDGLKRSPWLLRKLYVAPFSLHQIESYVEAYNKLDPSFRGDDKSSVSSDLIRDPEIKLEDCDKIPGLKELITTPFLLHLTVESLPDILAEHKAGEENQKITQAKLYDLFIERSFTRQVKKMRAANIVIPGLTQDSDIKKQFWQYCKNLARLMHAKEITVIPCMPKKSRGGLLWKQEKKNIWEPFFSEESRLLRSACPLKRMGEHHYGFIHASLVEYFATRAMYDEIQEEMLRPQLNKKSDNVREDMRKPTGGIHERVFAKERQAIRFIADRIEMSEKFKQKMLRIVEASKKNDLYAKGAANAITALVKAGVTFNGADLSGIKILGANISGGYFDSAEISNSDLRNCEMQNVWLRQANIAGSNFSGANFGEYPWLRQISEVINFDYREDLNRLVTANRDSGIAIWDSSTQEKLNSISLGIRWSTTVVRYSPNGEYLAFRSKSLDEQVIIWSVANWSEVTTLDHKARTFKFSSDGKFIILGRSKKIKICEVSSWKLIKKLDGVSAYLKCLAVSPMSDLIAAGSGRFSLESNMNEDCVVKIWDFRQGRLIAELNHEIEVECIAFNNDGSFIVSGASNKVSVWTMRGMNLVASLEDHTDTVCCVAFSPDNQRIVSGSKDKTIRVWDIDSQKVVFELRGHQNTVRSVQFSTDGSRVISGGDDTIRFWDISGEPILPRICGNYHGVDVIQISTDGKRVFLFNLHYWESSTDQSWGCVHQWNIWDLETRKELVVLNEQTCDLNKLTAKVAYSVDGKKVVCAYNGQDNSSLYVKDIENNIERQLLSKCKLHCIGFSIDTKKIVGGRSNGIIHVWDSLTGNELITYRGHDNHYIKSVVFSKNGTRVLSVGFGKIVRIWEVETGKDLAIMSLKKESDCAVFSPNEEFVAVHGDNDVYIFESGNGHELCDLPCGTHGGSKYVQFTHNSKRLIVGNKKSVQVWDITSQKCITILNLQDAKTFSYHINGTLVIGFEDRRIECWYNVGENNNYRWQLRWSTNIDNSRLNVEGLNATKLNGLDHQNRLMLKQRGASVIVNKEIKPDEHVDNIAYYDEMISLDSNDVEAYRNRAYHKYCLGLYTEAITDYDKVIHLKPSYFDFRSRGVCKRELGQRKNAIKDYNEAIRLWGRDSDAFRFRGICKSDLGLHLEAIADYDEVIKLKPQYASALRNRGMSKMHLGRYVEAQEDFEQGLEIVKPTGDQVLLIAIYSMKAFVFFLQDLNSETQNMLTEANVIARDIQNKTDPSFVYALNVCSLVRGFLLYLSGDRKESEYFLQTCIENNSDVIDRCTLMTMKGIAFSHLGCNEIAFDCWDQVINYNVEYENAIYHKEKLTKLLVSGPSKKSFVSVEQSKPQVHPPPLPPRPMKWGVTPNKETQKLGVSLSLRSSLSKVKSNKKSEEYGREIVASPEDSKLQSIPAKLITTVAQKSGSPLHQYPKIEVSTPDSVGEEYSEETLEHDQIQVSKFVTDEENEFKGRKKSHGE